jgi:hypothetical protein
MFSDLECGMSLTFILLSSPHLLFFSQLVPAAYLPLSLPLHLLRPAGRNMMNNELLRYLT